MKQMRSAILAACFCAGISAGCGPVSPQCDADLVLVNATVYTVDQSSSVANSVAIKGDRIVAVGDNLESECRSVAELDLDGAFVYPGFTDSHVHLLEVGYREVTLDLRDAASLKQAMDMVQARVQKNPPGEWIEGVGWIEKYWPENRFATIRDLDPVSPHHPVLLRRSDGHTILVNSKALQLAGIDRDTPNPKNGIIQREPDGSPNGILIDAAVSMVTAIMPDKSAVEDKKALELALRRNVRLGWTQTQNAGGNFHELGLLGELESEGKLLHRLYYALDEEASIDRLLDEGPLSDPDHYLTVRAIKVFADGALGSRGASLHESYADDNSTGLLFYSQPQIMPTLVAALAKGIQVETHAIGDRANTVVLDWYETAFHQVPPDDRPVAAPRWRIEHVQVIRPEDQDRLKALDVIPSMQPSHAIGDLFFAPTRLGPERVKNAYVWRGLIDRGLIIAGGTDAPVEVGDPRIEIYAAVARKDMNGYSNEDWHVEQAVSRETALKMFTIWPAYAAHQEDIRGSIEVGKLADFTVFDSDLMTMPADEILSATVVMTIVGGKIVYRKADE